MKVDSVDPNEKTEEIRKANQEAVHNALHEIEGEIKSTKIEEPKVPI